MKEAIEELIMGYRVKLVNLKRLHVIASPVIKPSVAHDINIYEAVISDLTNLLKQNQ